MDSLAIDLRLGQFSRAMAFFKKYAILLTILVIYLLLVARAWPFTWDDSGITLAFSRNLARFGKIVPSAFSDRVEGYSAFLWMIFNAAIFKVGFGENSVLFIAKFFTTALSITNIILLWVLIRSNIKSTLFQWACLSFYAINSYTIAAAADGMETSLYASLVLLSYLLYKHKNSGKIYYALFVLISSLLILIRHEGFLFLIPFFIQLLRERGRNILIEPAIITWAAVIIVYHTWHYLYFGEYLTNPMLAKRFWPYKADISNAVNFIIYYLSPLIDFAYHYLGIIFLAAVYFILEKKFQHFEPMRENEPLILLIILVSILIMIITGANWRAAGRLSYPGLVFILLFIFVKIDSPGLFISSRFFKFITLSCLSINLLIAIQLIIPLNPDIITLAGVEKRASSIDEVQKILKRPVITFAGVDMGGLLLFHGDGKKIIDLAMLCDRVLGKYGYAQLDNYVFLQSRPEIIEAHGNWLIPLHRSTYFTTQYIPVMVLTHRNEEILYFRSDIFDELNQKFQMPISNAGGEFKDIDQPTLVELGSFPVLDLKNVQ